MGKTTCGTNCLVHGKGCTLRVRWPAINNVVIISSSAWDKRQLPPEVPPPTFVYNSQYLWKHLLVSKEKGQEKIYNFFII